MWANLGVVKERPELPSLNNQDMLGDVAKFQVKVMDNAARNYREQERLVQ